MLFFFSFPQQFLNVPMFRNVSLKCLTEIAGVSVSQYEEQFVTLFTLTMMQLKQVNVYQKSPFEFCITKSVSVVSWWVYVHYRALDRKNIVFWWYLWLDQKMPIFFWTWFQLHFCSIDLINFKDILGPLAVSWWNVNYVSQDLNWPNFCKFLF